MDWSLSRAGWSSSRVLAKDIGMDGRMDHWFELASTGQTDGRTFVVGNVDWDCGSPSSSSCLINDEGE